MEEPLNRNGAIPSICRLLIKATTAGLVGFTVWTPHRTNFPSCSEQHWIEHTKTGKPCVVFNNYKYRQNRILKTGEVSWRCLGNNCGASIRTNANTTRVTMFNQKHSEQHPVTMRFLLSPLLNSRSANSSSMAAGNTSVSTPAASPAPDTSPAAATPAAVPPAAPPVCSTPCTDSALAATPSAIRDPILPGDEADENEIECLKHEYKMLLDHTIDSDSRLLQFTVQIFTVNSSSCIEQTARVSATVDCGVQCEPLLDQQEFSASSCYN
ncbi:hypothetical protein J6590_081090 [Homalodisca vitripennis]|nr:hypothetical protein J6590_081090 [Homalodisca vitripennis]